MKLIEDLLASLASLLLLFFVFLIVTFPGDLAAHAVPRQRRRRSELLGHVAPWHGRELAYRRDLE